MRKLLYTVALFVIASACSTKSESKPYNWEDDLHQRLLTPITGGPPSSA